MYTIILKSGYNFGARLLCYTPLTTRYWTLFIWLCNKTWIIRCHKFSNSAVNLIVHRHIGISVWGKLWLEYRLLYACGITAHCFAPLFEAMWLEKQLPDEWLTSLLVKVTSKQALNVLWESNKQAFSREDRVQCVRETMTPNSYD